MMMSWVVAEVDDVETLVEIVVRGGDTADAGKAKELMTQLYAALEPLVARPRFLGRLGKDVDDRSEIIVRVVRHLWENDFDRLRQFVAARDANPQLKFMTWLRVVAKRVGIDYLRSHPHYKRRYDKDRSRPGEWIDPGTLPPASQVDGGRPPMTDIATARELLAYAERELPRTQYLAIEQWTHHESFDDIATRLQLPGASAAEKLVRAALERLRRQYRPRPKN